MHSYNSGSDIEAKNLYLILIYLIYFFRIKITMTTMTVIDKQKQIEMRIKTVPCSHQWRWRAEHTDIRKSLIRHANGVHLSAVLKNTALIQGIRCEPVGEHLIPWTCAVFFNTARKWTPFVFSHTVSKTCNGTKKCTVDRHDRRP